jgi:hypothetical protein
MEIGGYSAVKDGDRRVQCCEGWRSEGTVLWRMEIGGYSTVEDGNRRVQYCGGWGGGVDTMKDEVCGGELWSIEVEGCENWRGDRGRGTPAVGGRC